MINYSKSEIRNSVIRELLEKVKKENYAKYLAAIRLEKIRHFAGAEIDFDFPVTALIGPNGGGKSTVLGACACAYVSIEPVDIFKKSRVGDENMDRWHVEYKIIDKEINPKGSLIENLDLVDNSWTRTNSLKRSVTLFGINRTVPAMENPLFSHKRMLSAYEKSSNTKILSSQVENIEHIKREAERILGKSLTNFQLLELTFHTIKAKNPKYIVVNREVTENGDTIITTRRPQVMSEEERNVKIKTSKKFTFIGDNGTSKYSEFHFGAGEASVIHMIADIETRPDNSLILIEEIENGLHPLAVHRMVEYLVEVAKRKNIQTIFTTHSDYALIPLPPEAIWAAIDGKLQQGRLTVEILRVISGRVDKRLAIFVEDEFAKIWLEAVIREKLSDRYEEIGVYSLFGDSTAVNTHENHLKNPAVESHSLCFIDGDSRQGESNEKRVFRLPGDAPEATIFNSVLKNIENNIALLTVACQRPPDKQNSVLEAIKNVSHTNRDPHLLFNQVGIKLNFTSEEIIRGAFLNIWIQENPEAAQKIIEPIKSALELPPKKG